MEYAVQSYPRYNFCDQTDQCETKENGELFNTLKTSLDNKYSSPLIDDVCHTRSGSHHLENASSVASTFSDGGLSSVLSDSGYKLPNMSRWVRMDEKLLHSDVKKFMKKNSSVVKKLYESRAGKSVRQMFKETISKILQSDEKDDNMDSLLRKALLPRSEIAQRLTMLSEDISIFMKQRQGTEHQTFGLKHVEREFKLVVQKGEDFALIKKNAPVILEVLLRFVDVVGTEKLINEMEAKCEKQNLPIDEFESRAADLKVSIDLFRFYVIEYMNCATEVNLNNLVLSIDYLSSTLRSISTRLWIVSTLIQALIE